MSLRERLATLIAGKRASEPIAFNPPMGQWFGGGIGHQPAHDTLLQESLGVADMATRAIANRISSLEPEVRVRRKDRSGTVIDETLDDHPLKMLLDHPNRQLSRRQLLRLTAQYILTVGEAYWLKIGSRLGIPSELYPMLPGRVTPLLSRGLVSGYLVRDGSGADIRLQVEEVVRLYFPDPEAPWASEGYLGPAGTVADSLKFAGQHLRSHFQNDATPKSVLEAGENATAFNTSEAERFGSMWRNRYHRRVGTDQGVPGILPTGYKLVELALQTGQEIVPLLEHWRDEQLMGFGVPRSVLGQVVSGDRSSAETNAYVFDRHTVAPVAEMMADCLTMQLASDFDPSIFVTFGEFVADDKDFRLKEEESDLKLFVRSINQVREDRNLDPVDWGEDPVATFGQVPYDPSRGFDLEMDDGSGFDDKPSSEPETDGDDAEPRSLARAPMQSTRAHWLRQIKVEKTWQPAMLKALREVFRQQRDSVLENLRKADAENPRSRAQVPDLSKLFDPSEWAALFDFRIEPIREAEFREVLRETLAGFGIDEFTFTDEMRKFLRAQGAALVTWANKTTARRIADEIEAAVAAGEGTDQIAGRISKVFGRRRKEARTIARTEVLKASSAANLAGYKASGVVEKLVWHTSMDDAVRDSHKIEGQTVALGQPFRLDDGEMADGPRLGANGSNLSAGNAINCRCFTTAVTR